MDARTGRTLQVRSVHADAPLLFTADATAVPAKTRGWTERAVRGPDGCSARGFAEEPLGQHAHRRRAAATALTCAPERGCGDRAAASGRSPAAVPRAPLPSARSCSAGSCRSPKSSATRACRFAEVSAMKPARCSFARVASRPPGPRATPRPAPGRTPAPPARTAPAAGSGARGFHSPGRSRLCLLLGKWPAGDASRFLGALFATGLRTIRVPSMGRRPPKLTPRGEPRSRQPRAGPEQAERPAAPPPRTGSAAAAARGTPAPPPAP